VAAAVLLAAGVVVIALTRRGRDGLAALGLGASWPARPCTCTALTLSLPGFLRLRGAALWFLIAVTASFTRGQVWWLVVALVLLAPAIPSIVSQREADSAIHPLGPRPDAASQADRASASR